MLIGIDASRANKEQKTGVEWYSYHLIEQFKRLDKDNRYFLYTNKPLDGALKNCPPNFTERVLGWFLPRTWTLARLSLEMKFSKKIPDVLFVPAHTIPLFNPKKSVVTVHDIGFEHLPAAYHWANKFYHKFIIHFIKSFATRIIAVSRFTKEDLVKTYEIPEEKISVVYNGYDSEGYKPVVDAAARLKIKYGFDFPFVLFIGRLEGKKNICRLVEAFIAFKQKYPMDKRKLILVGKSGIDKELDKAKEKIAFTGSQGEVIFPGWVAQEDLPLFLSAADVFFFPSLFEGFGIPVVEAMACGCPVICSKTTSLPEVTGEAALMFDPLNVAEMAARLEQVLLNESVAESLREKGFQRAKDFSWEKCAAETWQILVE